MVSNATHTPISKNTGGIDLATYGEAPRVSIPFVTPEGFTTTAANEGLRVYLNQRQLYTPSEGCGVNLR